MKSEELDNLSAEMAIEVLDKYIANHGDEDDAYFQRGLRYWSLSFSAKAIADWHTALKLNPESPAKEALKVAHDILDYRNTDLLNP